MTALARVPREPGPLAGSRAEPDIGLFGRLEDEIARTGAEDLRARWEFGQRMLRDCGENGRFPHGYLDRLAGALKRSRSELQYRAQFARRFPTERELSNALGSFGSWRDVVSDALPRDDKLAVHHSSATDQWETPQGFFDALDAEFGFELDVCALPSSAKCARYYTPWDDGLARDWEGVCWMNPPYGAEIPRWIAKASDSAARGATVVCLVPARVDTGWWWDYCRHGEIRFLRGRLAFGGGGTSAPFPSAVVIFGRPAGVVWWER